MQFVQNIAINAVEIFARALLAIYHYYCLSVFLPYSCLDPAHFTVQGLCPSLYSRVENENTACNPRVCIKKSVALRQLSTSRMASVHAMRRFR
ncbi:hypothetical protein B2M27_09440 [Kluyvera intermedia]|uniref:Secreted protein n=1 Tax=Kluyvera intermedia TaxID=61648 RepID=A0ABX3UH23_KLUIN|nr:hypothetical protein B2M27_09440 [Kluyvera intermedia]